MYKDDGREAYISGAKKYQAFQNILRIVKKYKKFDTINLKDFNYFLNNCKYIGHYLLEIESWQTTIRLEVFYKKDFSIAFRGNYLGDYIDWKIVSWGSGPHFVNPPKKLSIMPKKLKMLLKLGMVKEIGDFL